MAKYLDYTGLTQVWDAIKTNFVQSVTVGSGMTNTGSDDKHPILSVSLSNYTFLSGETAVTGDTTDRTYAVGLDSNGNLAVNVPWESGSSEDEKVRQTPGYDDVEYPILISAVEEPSGSTEEALYDSGFRINPNRHSLAEGVDTIATGAGSHAEGGFTIASGIYSHAEGNNNNPTDGYETYTGLVINKYNRSEGSGVLAQTYTYTVFEFEGAYVSVQAEKDTGLLPTLYYHFQYNNQTYTLETVTRGRLKDENITSTFYDWGTELTIKSLQSSDVSSLFSVEGEYELEFEVLAGACGANSHVEGNSTVAVGDSSHAEGYYSVSNGNYSHAEGKNTITTNEGEHAEGVFNKSITGALHTVGFGSDESSRANAHLITSDGLHFIPGVGGYLGDEDSMSLEYVEDVATVINNKQDILVAGEGIEISGNTISATGGGSGSDNKTPLTSITPTSTTTIDPYIMYDLGAVSSTITIAFNSSEEVSGYCAEYLITFTAGNNCNILLPSGVKYNGGSAPSYVSGRTYEINICNGLAVVGEFY